MAFYVVKYNGKTMVNTEFARDMYEMSDKKFISAVVSGSLKTTEILGNILVIMESRGQKDYTKNTGCVNIQTLNVALDNLVKVEEKTNNKLEFEKDIEVIVFEGIRFVRLSDIPVSGLYNKKEKIPHIKVCGSIYIALDCALKGNEEGCIIFTKKERK